MELLYRTSSTKKRPFFCGWLQYLLRLARGGVCLSTSTAGRSRTVFSSLSYQHLLPRTSSSLR